MSWFSLLAWLSSLSASCSACMRRTPRSPAHSNGTVRYSLSAHLTINIYTVSVCSSVRAWRCEPERYFSLQWKIVSPFRCCRVSGRGVELSLVLDLNRGAHDRCARFPVVLIFAQLNWLQIIARTIADKLSLEKLCFSRFPLARKWLQWFNKCAYKSPRFVIVLVVTCDLCFGLSNVKIYHSSELTLFASWKPLHKHVLVADFHRRICKCPNSFEQA